MKIAYQVLASIDVFDESEIQYAELAILAKRPFYCTETVPEERAVKFHRKYVADAVSSDFLLEFFTELCPDTTSPTAGALGYNNPFPAVAWNVNTDGYSIEAYISPLLDLSEDEKRQYKTLPMKERKIKDAKIALAIKKVMESLHNVLLIDYNDENFTFPSEIDVDFQQVELLL